MTNPNPTADKYIKIKKAEGLDYAELRQRIEQDQWEPDQVQEILDTIHQQLEKKRIRYHDKTNTFYSFVIGLILIGISVCFYHLGDGLNMIESAKGTGRREYYYLIGMLILFVGGISSILHGWTHWKR